ncbi:MAG: sigma-54-dependent Fis family transcriptional regulator [Acidobacteria bacterium]|nr:sigma-54-dependent Fis family transcriptional regulator [Acidobacteriota bacterium]MBI3426911.1 sigma-54-dependent Fis family transcriptional regulator [Acidobacteriota bacterium]
MKSAEALDVQTVPSIKPALQPRPALTLVNTQRITALEHSECFLGVSPNVAALKEFIGVQAAQRPLGGAVLFIGERGLRQEQIARVLHQASEDWAQPFMSVNAHGLSNEALHTLLFGSRGMIESNPHGTIYINELTSLPPLLQQRFAAHLEEQRWRAHSGRAQGPRLVFATEYDPAGMRAENRIAYGLVELLKPYSFTVKPLRERSEDISYLARHLVERLTRKLGKGQHEISAPAMRVLTEYNWTGNIDELEAVLECAIEATPPPQIDESLLPSRLRFATLRAIPDTGVDLPQMVDDYERTLIETALRQTGGNQTRASAMLGLRVQTLNMKLKRFRELGQEVKW